jgi:transposase-like protein
MDRVKLVAISFVHLGACSGSPTHAQLIKFYRQLEQKFQRIATLIREDPRFEQSNHRRQICTNNPLERFTREIRRRTRLVGAFQDGHSVSMLVAARLRHIASTRWGKQRYLPMGALLNPFHEAAAA